jgi:hypothetical protein
MRLTKCLCTASRSRDDNDFFYFYSQVARHTTSGPYETKPCAATGLYILYGYDIACFWGDGSETKAYDMRFQNGTFLKHGELPHRGSLVLCFFVNRKKYPTLLCYTEEFRCPIIEITEEDIFIKTSDDDIYDQNYYKPSKTADELNALLYDRYNDSVVTKVINEYDGVDETDAKFFDCFVKPRYQRFIKNKNTIVVTEQQCFLRYSR